MIHSIKPKLYSKPTQKLSNTSPARETHASPQETRLPSFQGSVEKFKVAHEIIQAADRTVATPVDLDPRPDFLKTGLGDMVQHADGFAVTVAPSGSRVNDIEFNANSKNGTITVTEYSPPGDLAGEAGGKFERYTLDLFQGMVTGHSIKSAPKGLPANASSGDAVFGKPTAPNRGEDFRFSGDGISSYWRPDSER